MAERSRGGGRLLSPAVVSAVVVGALLRLLWVVIATQRAPSDFSDPAEYLSMADGFAHGHLPRFHGTSPTAWFPPGYSMLLAPFVRLASATGWASPSFTASLVNVAAGTGTIVLVAQLARRWVAPGAAALAAWLLAVAPAQIMFTSTAHAESVFTLVVAGGAVAATALFLHRDGPSPVGATVALGVLAGYATLVRSPGLLVLVLPAALLLRSRRPWKEVARATLIVGAGAAIVLVPWTVRNGVQVGHWSPTSTNNAVALCVGHHPDFNRDYDPVTATFSAAVERDCFYGSPYAEPSLGLVPKGSAAGPPDEAAWYRRATAFGLRSAIEHPRSEVGWTARKLRILVLSEDGVVDAGRNFSDPGWAGGATPWLQGAAVAWLWAVEALAVVGAVRFRGLAALVAMTVLLILAPVVAVAYAHQHHPAMPFVVVLATAGIWSFRSRRRAEGEALPPDQPVAERSLATR